MEGIRKHGRKGCLPSPSPSGYIKGSAVRRKPVNISIVRNRVVTI